MVLDFGRRRALGLGRFWGWGLWGKKESYEFLDKITKLLKKVIY
jgi:hypothetical protein